MNKVELHIDSKRGTKIPVTIVEPDSFPARLLICAHGFKAKRTEDGRFLTVAEAMAEKGVLSVMMGFPGCDESKEDFINYTLQNCMDDIDSSYDYVKENYELDLKNVGMIGYSMGGRLTCLYIQKHPEIGCIGLWTAASADGAGDKEFLGIPLDQMKKEMNEKGYCDFHNLFDDTYIRLNKKLIEDMEGLSPEKGLSEFAGAAIIVHGDEDVTVPISTSENAYERLENAKKKRFLKITGADHGFGAWNDRPDLSKQLTDNTIAFFEENLL